MKCRWVITVFLSFLLSITGANAEGLLPSLSETIGKPMPSYGEALKCYPDKETLNEDGSTTEQYLNVSEEHFNTFSVYLEKEGASLQEYVVLNGIITATILADDASFFIQYDSQRSEIEITYPKGTYNERLERVKQDYKAAIEAYKNGQSDEAFHLLISIRGYMDVDEILKNDDNFAIRAAKLVKYQTVGSHVTFGRYPVTEKAIWGIDWLVLEYDTEKNSALLLSRDGLERKPYNDNEASMNLTWETCTLRRWLNSYFLNKAFTQQEIKAILTTNVDNSRNQGYSEWNIDGGNDTQDKIFLLSYLEANKYLGVNWGSDIPNKNKNARTAPTPYARQHYLESSALNRWWLRTPGREQDYKFSIVDEDGDLSICASCTIENCVRPALWIDLNADFF